MKKLFALLLALALILPAAALADLPDLTGLSFDDLIKLREKVNLAIFSSDGWQEVTVPAGIWKIGKDIPAGHWSFRPANESGYFTVYYCNKLNSVGTEAADDADGWFEIMSGNLSDDEYHVMDLKMKKGWYLLNEGELIFTPYVGKPDLGFK